MTRESAPDDWVTSKANRDCEEYVKERIERKINRYSRHGDRYRYFYWSLAIIAAIGSLLVPTLINSEAPSIFPTIISLVVGFSVALEGIFHPREISRNYDLLEALLREEEMLFSRRAGPYRPNRLMEGEDPCVVLTERIEAAIANEREATIRLRTSPPDEPSKQSIPPGPQSENNA
jgi:hypothetical protein